MKLDEEFYAFMREREAIRLRRAAGDPRELWTKDPYLARYKFTNVKRENDRTTRELVSRFYSTTGDEQSGNLLINCAMARFFGWWPTVVEIGACDEWDDHFVQRISAVVARRRDAGEKIFTGAYMIPNCGDPRPKHEVVIGILAGFASFTELYNDGPWASWRDLIEKLCAQINGVGSFMAKEVVLDYILVSGWRPDDWEVWTPMGPGARRGAARVRDGILEKPGGLSEPHALTVCRQLYASRVALWSDGPDLDLTDVQFQLCEFDKYMRCVDGGRAKTLFEPTIDDAAE